MKKLLAFLLALSICLTLCACASSPEAKITNKSWYCADYDLSFWFSDDGTAIATQDSEINEFTWKIVGDNEILFDFGDGDTELYEIFLITFEALLYVYT